jgi:hypothetical protein
MPSLSGRRACAAGIYEWLIICSFRIAILKQQMIGIHAGKQLITCCLS